MAARDPFGCSVNVQERLEALKQFTAAQCRSALQVKPLQGTVKQALDRRLDQLVDHHHRTKGKGRKR